MMKIKKMWKKAFGIDFDVDEKVLDEFIEWNTKQWDKERVDKNGYCFVNFIMIRKELSLMLPKILYAKAIQEEKKIQPIILDWGTDSKLEKLYQSFGMNSINLHKKMVMNITGIIKSLFITLKCRVSKISGEELQKLSLNGVIIGKSIYSDALRSSSLSTIKKVDNMICCKKIFSMVLLADTISKILNKYEPKVCISDDWAYNEGIVLEYMNQKNAFIVQTNMKRENILTIERGKFIGHRNSEMHEQVKRFLEKGMETDKAVVDEYLEQRFAGKNSSYRDKIAFEGKKTITSREEWNEQMGLDPKKKNVVIMCHTFSDAVFNSAYTAFRDYYDWTEQTLKIISKIDTVNWIVKPHPARAHYNEAADSIEDMFQRYATENMHFFPENISAASLKDGADALVTICGTAGTEFPCFGIPAIACGKAFYTGFGYTKTPETLDEYEQMLRDIKDMPLLSQEQIEQARKVLYAYIRCFETPLDEWDDMLWLKYKALQHADRNAENEGELTLTYNTEILKELRQMSEKDTWKHAEYYKRGKQLSKRIG